MDNSDFGMRLDALIPYLSSDKSDILKYFVSDLEVHIIEQKILSRFLSEKDHLLEDGWSCIDWIEKLDLDLPSEIFCEEKISFVKKSMLPWDRIQDINKGKRKGCSHQFGCASEVALNEWVRTFMECWDNGEFESNPYLFRFLTQQDDHLHPKSRTSSSHLNARHEDRKNDHMCEGIILCDIHNKQKMDSITMSYKNEFFV